MLSAVELVYLATNERYAQACAGDGSIAEARKRVHHQVAPVETVQPDAHLWKLEGRSQDAGDRCFAW